MPPCAASLTALASTAAAPPYTVRWLAALCDISAGLMGPSDTPTRTRRPLHMRIGKSDVEEQFVMTRLVIWVRQRQANTSAGYDDTGLRIRVRLIITDTRKAAHLRTQCSVAESYTSSAASRRWRLR